MRSMMPAQPKQTFVRRFAWALRLAGVLLVLSGNLVAAQDVPIVSGALGFFDSKNTGVNFFQPVAAPVVVAPLGKHFLAESRFDLRGVYIRQNGTSGPYQGSFVGTTQYLQLDYLASRRITFTAGRFLTPFGTYNERLSAIWIAKLQDGPLIFPIGTRTTGSSNGVMVRGALFANPTIHVNYIGYFSASSNAAQFQAGRAAGYRFDFYFPSKRVEIGTSYRERITIPLVFIFGGNRGGFLWKCAPNMPTEHTPKGTGLRMPTGSRSGKARTACSAGSNRCFACNRPSATVQARAMACRLPIRRKWTSDLTTTCRTRCA
jgi:hypothetical protein